MAPLFLRHTVYKSRLHFPKREIRVRVHAGVCTYLKNALSRASCAKKYHALTEGFPDLFFVEILL